MSLPGPTFWRLYADLPREGPGTAADVDSALSVAGTPRSARVLDAFGRMLAPGGAVAFSEPVWLTETPPVAAAAFWTAYPAMTDAAGVAGQITAAGWRTLATRILPEAAWAAYYTSLSARIAALRPRATPAMSETLDAAAAEVALRRDHGDAYGYLLSVVRPA